MTEKEDKKRIKHLEEAVTHLILAKQDEEKLANYFDKEMTLEEHHKRDQTHKTVFQKFLNWIEK